MLYAIITVPVASLRAEPSHKSKLLSQVLCGECVTILKVENNGWKKIKCQYDGYEGWLYGGQLEDIDQELFDAPYTHYTPNWITVARINGSPMKVPYGCLIKKNGDKELTWGKARVQLEALRPLPVGSAGVPENYISEVALHFLNSSYLFGGRSVFGIDCTGFTQSVYRMLGVFVHRDISPQASQGREIASVSKACPGDLAFFMNEEGRFNHAGLLLENHKIIHALEKVRIDILDDDGIIDINTGVHIYRLKMIKRVW